MFFVENTTVLQKWEKLATKAIIIHFLFLHPIKAEKQHNG